jgi:hypothetical protein
VLKGNPADEFHVSPSLKRHLRRSPALYGADRGFFSENNVTVCVRGGVATVSIPQHGGCKTPRRLGKPAEEPREDPHHVPQQGIVGRMMNVGFHRRGVEPAACCRSELHGSTHDEVIDGLERRRACSMTRAPSTQ